MTMATTRLVLLITVSLLCETSIAPSPLAEVKTGLGRRVKDFWKASVLDEVSEALVSRDGCRVGIYSVQGYATLSGGMDRYSTMQSDKLNMTGFAVYDGHYDWNTAEFAREGLLTGIIENLENNRDDVDPERVISQTILEFNNKILERGFVEESGSTALIGILHGQYLYVAHLGDTRAVAHRTDNAQPWTLTDDHVPSRDAERPRIEAHGGAVTDSGTVKRWKGKKLGTWSLPVSRSLGDQYFKPDIVIADPTVTQIDWKKDKIDFVIVGTHTLWTAVQEDWAVKNVSEAITKNDRLLGARVLTEKAKKERFRGDLTVMVVKMPKTTA